MSKITILTPEQLAERDRRAKQQLPLRPSEAAPSEQPSKPAGEITPPLAQSAGLVDELTPPLTQSTGIFERTYPNITLFIADFGCIEIGNSDGAPGFVRAFDEGGMVWHGEDVYASLDAAFDDLEQGLEAWLDEELPDEA